MRFAISLHCCAEYPCQPPPPPLRPTETLFSLTSTPSVATPRSLPITSPALWVEIPATIRYVQSEVANLRSEPSTKGQAETVVGQVYLGWSLELCGHSLAGDWYRLCDSETWIYEGLLHELAPTPTTIPTTLAKPTYEPALATQPHQLDPGCLSQGSTIGAMACSLFGRGSISPAKASEILELAPFIESYNFTLDFEMWILAALLTIQQTCQDQKGRFVPMSDILATLLVEWELSPIWQTRNEIAVDAINFLGCGYL